MNIKQIQIALRKSGMFSGFIRMGEDKLMFPSELGMYGTFTTLSLVGESGCMIKHPVIPYETPEQARVFLDECTKSSVEYSQMEFYDDPISERIMAVLCINIKSEKRFLETIASTVASLVCAVKGVRDSIANVVLDAISPVEIDCPTRSLFYLSLMSSYECPWGWSSTWGGQIDWNDVKTVWNHSKSVFFLPFLKEGNLYMQISEHIEQFLKGEPGYLVAYFGLPYYAADTSDALGVDDMIRRFSSRYGCRGLSGIKMVDSLSAPPKIALVAILK